jgi:2-phosphosulfolactate phosphatase
LFICIIVLFGAGMDILRLGCPQAAEARGIVIVIDVIRAFSVAGYAFAGGARGIWMVREVEEAQRLREREPEALLIGEVGGRMIPGFDLNNSPSLMARANVRNRQLIQRTGAGTQGAVGASGASCILLCALTNARATAAYAGKLAAETGDCITLLPTFTRQAVPWTEDETCADYVEALITGQDNAAAIEERGRQHLEEIGRLDNWKRGDADFPFEDIAAVFDVDKFSFAMVGKREEWQGISFVEARRVDVSV